MPSLQSTTSESTTKLTRNEEAPVGKSWVNLWKRSHEICHSSRFSLLRRSQTIICLPVTGLRSLWKFQGFKVSSVVFTQHSLGSSFIDHVLKASVDCLWSESVTYHIRHKRFLVSYINSLPCHKNGVQNYIYSRKCISSNLYKKIYSNLQNTATDTQCISTPYLIFEMSWQDANTTLHFNKNKH